MSGRAGQRPEESMRCSDHLAPSLLLPPSTPVSVLIDLHGHAPMEPQNGDRITSSTPGT